MDSPEKVLEMAEFLQNPLVALQGNFNGVKAWAFNVALSLTEPPTGPGFGVRDDL